MVAPSAPALGLPPRSQTDGMQGCPLFPSGCVAVLLKCSHTESMLRFCAARALPEAKNQTPHYRHAVFRAGLLAYLHPRLFSFPVSQWF